MLDYEVLYPDVNAGKKDYKHLEEKEILVSSHFFTLQGEGPYMGQPAVFLRTSGCNLGNKKNTCPWCDTDFRLHLGQKKTFAQIHNDSLSMIRDNMTDEAYERLERPVMVLTGGEPMLQDNLGQFTKEYENEWQFQIETNGTMFCEIGERTTLVCSPKAVLGKGYPKLRREVFDRADCLKFVVAAQDDDPHTQIPDYAFEFARTGRPVYVSPIMVYKKAYVGEVSNAWNPELVDHPATERNHSYAARLALEHGFQLNMQMHNFATLP